MNTEDKKVMNFEAILPVKMNDELDCQAVLASQLHDGLEVRKKFSDWIKNKLLENSNYEESLDYVKVFDDPQKGFVDSSDELYKQIEELNPQQRSRQGIKTDYVLTLDVAKMTAMSTNTDKGQEVRKYFLNCEKVAQEETRLSQKALGQICSKVNTLTELVTRMSQAMTGLEVAVDRKLISNPPVAVIAPDDRPSITFEEFLESGAWEKSLHQLLAFMIGRTMLTYNESKGLVHRKGTYQRCFKIIEHEQGLNEVQLYKHSLSNFNTVLGNAKRNPEKILLPLIAKGEERLDKARSIYGMDLKIK